MQDAVATLAPPRKVGDNGQLPALDDPSLYINRELSWLEFNRRVLDEALDPAVPLLERIKFLAIFAANLDEFFMVRVGGLLQKMQAGIAVGSGADRMAPRDQLAAIAQSIRKMVHDLNFPVEIVACPTVREPDGLAMSSRNAYLNAAERKQALVLSRALREVEKKFAAGERGAGELMSAAKTVLAREPSVTLDYLEIVNPETLDPVPNEDARGALVAVAAFVGGTRLIDNVVLGGKRKG